MPASAISLTNSNHVAGQRNTHYAVGSIRIPDSQTRTLRLRVVKPLAQSHTARKWQSIPTHEKRPDFPCSGWSGIGVCRGLGLPPNHQALLLDPRPLGNTVQKPLVKSNCPPLKKRKTEVQRRGTGFTNPSPQGAARRELVVGGSRQRAEDGLQNPVAAAALSLCHHLCARGANCAHCSERSTSEQMTRQGPGPCPALKA